MKVFATKYCLAVGIEEVEIGSLDGPADYVFEKGSERHFVMGTSAFQDRGAAVKDAENKRTRKIASLKQEIATLETLRFEQ